MLCLLVSGKLQVTVSFACKLKTQPVLLGTRSDLARVRQQTVGITAIDTVELLHRVQVGQVLPVDDDELATANPRNSIQPEADRLEHE